MFTFKYSVKNKSIDILSGFDGTMSREIHMDNPGKF